jgi:hypothetical protein
LRHQPCYGFLQLAKCYHFQHCIIEGDTKNCIDACNGKFDECSWALFAICHDVKFLLQYFSSVVFNLVRREANVAAYALATLALQSQIFLICNNDSLLPLVYKAWLRNVIGCV